MEKKIIIKKTEERAREREGDRWGEREREKKNTRRNKERKKVITAAELKKFSSFTYFFHLSIFFTIFHFRKYKFNPAILDLNWQCWRAVRCNEKEQKKK